MAAVRHVLCLAVVAATVACVVSSTVSDRACSKPGLKSFPFCDTTLSTDARVTDLISRLPADVKPKLLTARGSPRGNITPVPSLGVPAFDWGLNALHGVQSSCGSASCATSFPMPNALGATFNTSLVKDMAAVIGVELRALWLEGATEASAWSGQPHIGLDTWSPNINIARDPRWGRNMEVPGEDPYHNAQYGVAYTTGLQQGQDPRYLQAVVTLKHWDAYSLEDSDGYTRYDFDAIVTPYDLHATYTPAFKASVAAGAKGVMCSYNALNGVPTCASPFLKKLLRETWNFTGYVTSDSGAIGDIYSQHKYVKTPEEACCAAIVGGGCDMNSGPVFWDYLGSAVEQGLCTSDDVDGALMHTLRLRFQLGLFDPIEDQPYWHVPPTAVGTPAAKDLSLRGSREGMVLLKNDDGTLPFKPGQNVAVIGPNANSTANILGNYLGDLCRGGYGDFSCVQTILGAIDAANVDPTTGKHGSVCYAEGATVTGTSTDGFAAAVACAKQSDVVLMVLGTSTEVEAESHDRVNITLPGVQSLLAAQVLAAGKPTAVVLTNGGVLAVPELKKSAGAIVEAWFPGVYGGRAVADVIFGAYNPGGKLPVTMYDGDYVNQIMMDNMNMTASATSPGRTYRYFTGTPLYPFGHGLSYTTFTVTWAQSPKPIVLETGLDDSTVTMTATVANTGAVAGDEVVLAFIKPNNVTLGRKPDPERDDPVIRRLFGYQRVHLAPGQHTSVTFTFGAATLAQVDRLNGDRISVAGSYDIQLTNGVDQELVTGVVVQGEPRVVEAFPRM